MNIIIGTTGYIRRGPCKPTHRELDCKPHLLDYSNNEVTSVGHSSSASCICSRTVGADSWWTKARDCLCQLPLGRQQCRPNMEVGISN